jgi:hypothetical protein
MVADPATPTKQAAFDHTAIAASTFTPVVSLDRKPQR